jgi:tRNA(Ile)-lysidine synthase
MKERKQSVSAVLCAVEKTIREHDLLRPKDRILVAVSGGPDSVALFHILLQLSATWRWALAVAHLHHGLRGRDADEDLAFVKQMAKEANLPFFDRKLPLGYLKRMRGSLQETARRERYRILEALRSEWKGHKIALGHQADDQTETVLAALLRGAGTKGLSGMFDSLSAGSIQRGPRISEKSDPSRTAAHVARPFQPPHRRDATEDGVNLRRSGFIS